MVDVIKPEGYACDDNVLPEAIEDIPEPIEEQTPQPSHFSDKEVVTQPVEEEVTQPLGVQEQEQEKPVSNVKIVELVECPDCKEKMTKQNAEVFSC